MRQPALRNFCLFDPKTLVPICRTVFLYVEHSCSSAVEGCQLGAVPRRALRRRAIDSQEFFGHRFRLARRGSAFAESRQRALARPSALAFWRFGVLAF